MKRAPLNPNAKELRRRANIGRLALRAAQDATGNTGKYRDEDYPISDLIADLLHYGVRANLRGAISARIAQGDRLLQRARNHFEAETRGQE